MYWYTALKRPGAGVGGGSSPYARCPIPRASTPIHVAALRQAQMDLRWSE